MRWAGHVARMGEDSLQRGQIGTIWPRWREAAVAVHNTAVYNMAKGTKKKDRRILSNESEADIVVSMFVQLHWQMFVSHLFKNVQKFFRRKSLSLLDSVKFPRNTSSN